jgi:hypothetical protein
MNASSNQLSLALAINLQMLREISSKRSAVQPHPRIRSGAGSSPLPSEWAREFFDQEHRIRLFFYPRPPVAGEGRVRVLRHVSRATSTIRHFLRQWSSRTAEKSLYFGSFLRSGVGEIVGSVFALCHCQKRTSVMKLSRRKESAQTPPPLSAPPQRPAGRPLREGGKRSGRNQKRGGEQ